MRSLRLSAARLRSGSDLARFELAIHEHGFVHVAGVDEAGRGACAGPLVAAAVILRAGIEGIVPGLDDSKLLSPASRQRVYEQICQRALSFAIIAIPASQIDVHGVHVANLEALRRAVACLSVRPDYVLSDGFVVDGLGVPSVAIWKGDQVAAAVAAASVLAKVARDQIMTQLHDRYPHYGFARHKGYSTAVHTSALAIHGPCEEHRFSYANVSRAQLLWTHNQERELKNTASRVINVGSNAAAVEDVSR